MCVLRSITLFGISILIEFSAIKMSSTGALGRTKFPVSSSRFTTLVILLAASTFFISIFIFVEFYIYLIEFITLQPAQMYGRTMRRDAASPSRGQWLIPKPTSINDPLVLI